MLVPTAETKVWGIYIKMSYVIYIYTCMPYMGRIWWLHVPQPLLLTLEDPVLLGLMHDLGFTNKELGQLKVCHKYNH